MGHAHGRTICLAFPASALAVRQTLEAVLEHLHAIALPQEECGTVEIVLAEVLNNIVEHACADTGGGRIHLAVSQAENGLCFDLRDNGRPMPDGQIPLGNRALTECMLEDLPEGGFGWFLIRDLAHDLSYTREGAQNRLQFRIAVDIPEFQAG